jgi:hypothetical protein
MMVGVAAGILNGAAVVALAGVGALQLVLGTLIALVLATAAGTTPLIRNQAAASTILVVALHSARHNLAVQRLVDALLGGGVAILLARFLFPVDPLELVRDEARDLRRRLAEALELVADALGEHDRGKAREALARIDAIDERRLEDALTLAREVARKAPRRRPLRRRLEALGESWLELDASVSDAHAVATGALRLLDGGRPAAGVAEAVRAAARAVRAIEPQDARATAEAARAAALQIPEADSSLGAGVIAHGVANVAGHALRAAAAREEDRKLAAERRNRNRSAAVWKRRR